MPGLKLMCPICTDDLEETNEIYATSCGHIYHHSCMRQWQSRSTSCPQCRHHNPTSYKLYLIINDAPDESVINPDQAAVQQDLNTRLESSVDKINELTAQNQEAELNFFHLQEQYTIEQELRRRLEQRAAEFTNNEDNFLKLHAQYTELEHRVKLLEEENERLTLENEFKAEEITLNRNEIAELSAKNLRVNNDHLLQLHENVSEYEDRLKMLQQENRNLIRENESKSKEIQLKSREILALKNLSKENCKSDDVKLKAKLKILEDKLEQVTQKLDKEISNSMQLSIDRIKLQSQIQRMHLQKNCGEDRPRVNTGEENKRMNITNSESKPQNIKSNKVASKSVVFQKFPYNEIKYPLEDVIILIASKIEVNISKEDIVKANILDRIPNNKPPKDVCVYVEFRTDDLKNLILSKARLLKTTDVSFKSINIKEYIDRKIHSVFGYANRKLREVGFSYITCKHNCVVAKKNINDMGEFQINNKREVDELVLKYSGNPTSLP
ncbi:uncharacterized protein LOC142231753 [Haematobia irritans]|uniref:uncharacterized protein LOC142231753 n=1 Tax=Haematobia irritans TaxID=7368 RepID=UPI003F50AE38